MSEHNSIVNRTKLEKSDNIDGSNHSPTSGLRPECPQDLESQHKDYIAGALDPVELLILESHLDQCSSCEARWEEATRRLIESFPASAASDINDSSPGESAGGGTRPSIPRSNVVGNKVQARFDKALWEEMLEIQAATCLPMARLVRDGVGVFVWAYRQIQAGCQVGCWNPKTKSFLPIILPNAPRQTSFGDQSRTPPP